jgi:GT2 family glycosyltransferase
MRSIPPSRAQYGGGNRASSSAINLRISVVVATFNRRESLRRLLESLSRQSLLTDQFEVIIVSDGASDGTVEFVRELKTNRPNLTLLELQRRGPAAARNAGARLARGRFLAFTDDDCLASETWLEQLLIVFAQTDAVAVQGCTTTDRAARSPLTHYVEILSPCLTSMPTCNAAYRKDIFDAAGGFDEAFRFAHNEDADLAWRVEDMGKIVFAPEAHIIHPPRPDTLWKRARWVQSLESEFTLYYKNPDKYRRYISQSPWLTIYWNVFVIGQLRLVKSNCKYLIGPFKPHYFIIGIGLILARSFNLIRFFPGYFRARARYRSLAQCANVTKAREAVTRHAKPTRADR